MILRAIARLSLAPLTLLVLHADVTVRYKTEFKINSALSALAPATATSQELVLRLKGSKGLSESQGYSSIFDFTTQEITLLNTAAKRYAKLTSDQFADEMTRVVPEMPAQAREVIASMKISASPARATGRTAVIQGVEVEEREIVSTIEAPDPADPPSPFSLRMVLQLWTPKDSEILRVPAIRELTGYSLWTLETMNPTAGMGRMMKHFSASTDSFEPLVKEMRKGTLLRMRMDLFMPGMAAMLRQLPEGTHPFGAGFDPNTPFMQMNVEMTEFSSVPVPDSVFQIPEGYQEAPVAELIKGIVDKIAVAPKP